MEHPTLLTIPKQVATRVLDWLFQDASDEPLHPHHDPTVVTFTTDLVTGRVRARALAANGRTCSVTLPALGLPADELLFLLDDIITDAENQ
jgi:hypothetical protein